MEREDEVLNQQQILKDLEEKIKAFGGVFCPLELAELGLLDYYPSYEIFRRYHYEIPEPNSETYEEMIEILKRSPRPQELLYLHHMELTGHSQSFLYLCENIKLKAPMLDLGTGIGHLIWHLWYNDILPAGRIALLDVNAGSIDYTREILTSHCHKVENVEEERIEIDGKSMRRSISAYRKPLCPSEKKWSFSFHVLDGCDIPNHLEELGGPFQTILSSLVLQWVQKPKEMIEAVAQSLRSDGEFVLIGEDDPDAVAPAISVFPLSLPKGKPFEEIKIFCENVGLSLVKECQEDVRSSFAPRRAFEQSGIVRKDRLEEFKNTAAEFGFETCGDPMEIKEDKNLLYVSLTPKKHKMVLTVWRK
jgi:SAM-dependent methyltransferase